MELRRYAAFVAIGSFVTFGARPYGLAMQPIQYLLKEGLGLSVTKVALFFTVATAAWYIKPLFALLTDQLPLLGSSRMTYLVGSALLGAGVWALMAGAPAAYGTLLLLMTLGSAAVALGNTVVGAIVVEQGRAHGSTGELVSLRELGMNAVVVLAPVGGWLERSFGLACALEALLLIALVALAAVLPRAPHRALPARADAARAGERRYSRALLAAMLMMFLFCAAPGNYTVLYFYRSNVLGLSGATIGMLTAVSGISGLLGAAAYGALCRRWSAREMLIPGILVNAAASLLYLFYSSLGTAFAVEAGNGFFTILGLMPVQDLAARSAPRGSEAMGYALAASAGNLGLRLADMLGAQLTERLHLSLGALACVSAATTALSLGAVPLLGRGARGGGDAEG